jgi:peptidoglycan/LPS O-acetylase OafA/YrhL
LLGYVIQNIIVVPLMITILISVATRKKHILSFLGNKFFEYLGKISYSFYIVQIPIMLLLEKNIGFKIHNTSITFSIIFFTNLLGAILLYHIIESPFHQYVNTKIKHIFSKNPSLQHD